MRYTEIFPTRLSAKLAEDLKGFSDKNELPESVVVRLALRHFFECEYVGLNLAKLIRPREDDTRRARKKPLGDNATRL